MDDELRTRLEELNAILAILEQPTYKIWTIEAAARGQEFEALVHPSVQPAITALRDRRKKLLGQDQN